MKIFFATVSLLFAALSLTQAQEQKPTPPNHRPVPPQVAYRHFLGMVNDLVSQTNAAGNTDPYAFAQPFARAGMENADLDVLRQEAQVLAVDLAQHDAKVKTLVAVYRQRAIKAGQLGQPLPPEPVEIHNLEALRTAIMIHHMVVVKRKLGPEKTARLEAYLDREFIPKVSLKVLARAPVAPPQ